MCQGLKVKEMHSRINPVGGGKLRSIGRPFSLENDLEKIPFPLTEHESQACRKTVYYGQSKVKLSPTMC